MGAWKLHKMAARCKTHGSIPSSIDVLNVTATPIAVPQVGGNQSAGFFLAESLLPVVLHGFLNPGITQAVRGISAGESGAAGLRTPAVHRGAEIGFINQTPVMGCGNTQRPVYRIRDGFPVQHQGLARATTFSTEHHR